METKTLTKLFHNLGSEFDKRFDRIDESINELKAAVLGIEDTLKFYGDMYKINQDGIDRRALRTNNVENKVGIKPKEELAIRGN